MHGVGRAQRQQTAAAGQTRDRDLNGRGEPPLRFGGEDSLEGLGEVPLSEPPLRISRFRQIGGTMLIMLATTAAAFLVRPARGEVSGALVFVLGILSVGSLYGMSRALLASSLSFLLYNFYFAEPILTFRVDTVSDLTPLIVFNATAVIVGILAGRLRDQAEAAALANRRLTALLAISRSLQSSLSFDDIRHALEEPAGRGVGIRQVDVGARAPAEEGVAGAVRVACDGQDWTLSLVPTDTRRTGDAAMRAALVSLVALALERASLAAKIAEAEAMSRAEALKTSLLSSVSHDLRTPLATISASASSLLEFGAQLDGPTATRFLRTILDESERLNRVTANLLEMTRLEAGRTPPGQIISVSDILSAAIRRVRPRIGTRLIERADECDCLVLADPTLFELAIGNVLENALLYSADGTRICLSVTSEAGRCIIEIADEGRGVPPAELERIFDRFHRVDRSQQMPRGTGLGLAIARGFVNAFGGRIVARVPGIGGRGTTIRIELPLAPAETA